MADIFVSYAREDRARDESIVRALGSKGWSIWWDRSIHVGKTFSREIERELDGARCVVVLWSSRSIDSDWVLAEAAEGMRRGVLIPIAIEESLKIPLVFRRLQTANLAAWPSDPAEFEDCVHAIATLLESPDTSSRAVPRVDVPSSERPAQLESPSLNGSHSPDCGLNAKLADNRAVCSRIRIVFSYTPAPDRARDRR